MTKFNSTSKIVPSSSGQVVGTPESLPSIDDIIPQSAWISPTLPVSDPWDHEAKIASSEKTDITIPILKAILTPPVAAPIATPVTTEDDDLDALIAQAEQQAEKAAKRKKLAALIESNRLAEQALELTKIELKNDTDSKIEQLRAESKQRIAAMAVSQAGTLSDEDIQAIRAKQDEVASDSKKAFLGKFLVVKELNDQRIQAEDTKLRSELQVEIDRIKDATPLLKALSGTPQPGEVITLKSAADQTIDATVV
jgi:hypothetical protein